MSPKPWEVTDDELAQGAIPAEAGSDEGADADTDDYVLVDGDEDLDEWNDPWSTESSTAAPVVPRARPIESREGQSRSTVPAARPVAAPGAAPVNDAQTEATAPAEPLSGSEVGEQGPAADPDPGASAEPSPEPETAAVPEQASTPETGPAPDDDLAEPASASEAPASVSSDVRSDDDFDDFWDEPVTPSSESASSGYDLSPSPVEPFEPVQTIVPAGDGAVEDGDEFEDSDPDDSITVTLRRNREPQQSATSPREYRTSTESRRPVRPSERRHKMDAAPVKQGPMAKLKKLWSGDSDLLRAHETSAKRDTIRPLNVVVMGKKGGVGKTVVTTLLGHTFASVRKDRVLAVDASPTGGNLSARCPKEGRGTVVSLLDQLEYVTAYANVREHTAKGETGLEVLGADVTRPQRPITGQDYRQLMDELRRHYQLILSDTPGDITTASTDGPDGMVPALLDEADLLVLVAEGVDGANAATWLVNWLKARLRETDDRHLEQLLDDLIVVVTSRTPKSNAKPEPMARYFSEEIARRVVQVPFDPVVEGGLEIDYNLISPGTRKAMLALADAVTASDAFTGR